MPTESPGPFFLFACLRNYTSCETVDKQLWSNGPASEFSSLIFNGLAQWSTFTLTTYDHHGKRRTRGGDSW